jgi:hypothetical protein
VIFLRAAVLAINVYLSSNNVLVWNLSCVQLVKLFLDFSLSEDFLLAETDLQTLSVVVFDRNPIEVILVQQRLLVDVENRTRVSYFILQFFVASNQAGGMRVILAQFIMPALVEVDRRVKYFRELFLVLFLFELSF